MFADAGGQIVEQVADGGSAAVGASMDAVAVVMGGVDGTVLGSPCDAELGGEVVEGRGGGGAEAFANLVGGAEERECGGRGNGSAEDMGQGGVR